MTEKGCSEMESLAYGVLDKTVAVGKRVDVVFSGNIRTKLSLLIPYIHSGEVRR